MPTADELWMEAQWESEGVRRAAERYKEAAEVADPSTLPSGQRLLREVVPPLSRRIAELQGEAVGLLRASRGDTRWAAPIQLLPADVLSVITVARALRGAEDEFADGAGLTVLSRDIAQAVRDEFDYRTWMAEQAKAKRDAREDGIADYVDLRRAFQARYPNADARAWRRFSGKLELARTDWDQETQVQLGAALVQALADAAPTHFVIDTRRLEGGRTQKFLRLSAETSAVMRDVEERASISRPQLMPMLIPPLPWRYEQ